MNKIVIILSLLLLITPISTQAHTTLTSSNPAEGEVLQMPPEQLELVFGTIIEEGSTMTLEGPDQTYEVENISITENVMTGAISGELPNGQYIISWNIIGEDGHPIEGQIPFSLDAEIVSEEPPAESETPEETATEEQAESPEATESADSTQEEGGLWSTVLIVAAALLVGFALYKLLKKKA